jgi:hypothetical protein
MLFSPSNKMKIAFVQQQLFSESATLPFVISTEAKRSGEISVWRFFLGNVFLFPVLTQTL